MSISPFIIPILGISCGLLAIIGGVFVRPWIRYKERQLELLSDQTAERAAQYAAKTERLEQRVAVLERILTDRSTALGDEIERLRDTPIN
jgi:hypothetical protein